MINTLYCCAIQDPWLEVAKSLEQKNIIAKYWIGWEVSGYENIENELKSVVFHNISKAWKGQFPNKVSLSNSTYLDGTELAELSFEELMALKMMERLDPDQNSFTFNERQFFFRTQLNKWINLLVDLDIKLIIAPSIPHRVFDYIIYIAAKILNLNYYTLKMTGWPGHLIPFQNINRIPKIFNTIDYNTPIEDDVINFVSKIQGNYDNAEPHYMKSQKLDSKIGLSKRVLNTLSKNKYRGVSKLFKEKNSYWKKAKVSIQNSSFLTIEAHYQKFQGIRFKNNLKFFYESICVKPDFKNKYILIALHYQPEETSNPSGGIYVDQKLMINALLKHLPKNFKLFVKEHSSQFNPTMEGETGRDKSFYEYYKDIGRVNFISTNNNIFELIDNSYGVATLTGTIGVEALLRKKYVIVFGAAWYEHLSGVIKIDNSLKLLNLFDSIQQKFSYSLETITAELNAIYVNSLKANHYKGVKERTNITQQESIDNLVDYFSNNLLKNGKC